MKKRFKAVLPAVAACVMMVGFADLTSAEILTKVGSGANGLIVENVADYATVAKMLKVKPGDQITLPPLAGSASYKVLNHSFLTLDGLVLTALKPGIVGVECYDASGALATTMGVLVLPEKIGSGNIYILKETVGWGGDWCTAAMWRNVDGTQATDFPRSMDDIAIIPHDGAGGKMLSISQDISLGGIYAGCFKSVNGDSSFRITPGTAQALTFWRSDGEPVVIQLCGNVVGYNNKYYMLYFGVNFTYASDTIVDGGWDGVDFRYAGGRPFYTANCTHTVPSGVTLVWRNTDATGGDRAQTFTPPILVGGGTVWNRSAAKIWFKDGVDYSGFTGTIRDSGYGSDGAWMSHSVRLVTGSISNAAAEVCGFVHNDSGRPAIDFSGAGNFSTGGNGSIGIVISPHADSWFPKRGLTMINSSYACEQIEDKSWGVGVAEKKLTDRLTIGGGFSYIAPVEGGCRSNAKGYPLNWFEAATLSHQDKATLRVDLLSNGGGDGRSREAKSKFLFHGVEAFEVGGAGSVAEDLDYPIVPWMVSKTYADPGKIFFACRDEDGFVFDEAKQESRKLDEAVGSDENAYVNDLSIKLTENRTVNSLWLCNSAQDNDSKNLGSEENTLTVTSGGVILHDNDSGIGTQDRPAENGKLVLGDATHPGYVFAGATDPDKPNGIWAKVTAPGGLVFGYTGYALLAGDQTGVDDELVVNAGTLDLGSQDKSVACTLDVPVRILANATVKMNNVSMVKSDIYFDDIAGYSGKIQLNAGETRCRKLYVRDTPEESEWTVLDRGTYGATGSGAQFIDDDRFAGTGILTVLKGDETGMIILVM